ncbi:hypothetical protein CHS0354_030525 [Potamilus streckersoni]|uniref:D-isomer specific 2-hydroxyacid dehydrogenase catalytic domain-containing protein n=1 Tax=Potamilus streckersoni TaxID=2493646 RepID=A0AAE0VGN0_9BIVA|nr:hypothetical protein CHS0354_030525 [Potamilus streckersoni]
MSATPRPTVFVSRGIPLRAADLLREHVDLREWSQERDMTPEEILQAVPGIHGLLVHPPTRVDKAVLDAAGPQLKVVGTMSVGLDHIDLSECASRKIAVGYTPDVLTDAAAELTVALTLSTCRRFKEGKFVECYKYNFVGFVWCKIMK